MKTCFDLNVDFERKIKCMAEELNYPANFSKEKKEIIKEYIREKFAANDESVNFLNAAIKETEKMSCEDKIEILIKAGEIMARVDEFEALKLLGNAAATAMEECEDMEYAMCYIAQAMAPINFGMAREILSVCPARIQNRAVEELARTIAPLHPAGALLLCEESDNCSIRDKLYSIHPDILEDFKLARGTDTSVEQHMMSEIRRISKEDMEKALSIARKIETPELRIRALSHIASENESRSADIFKEAVEYVKSRESLDECISLAELLIQAMKESGDENADTLIEHCLNEIKSLGADGLRNLCDFAEFLIPVAPERVAGIIDEMSECTMLCDLYHDIPARLVSYMAPKEPAMALELAKKVKEEKRDITLVDACYHLLDSIKDRTPRNALIIAREIKDRRMRDECLESIARELAGEDTAMALKIAGEISYRYGKELVYLATVENSSEEQFESTISLLEEFEYPELRARALLALAKKKSGEDAMQLLSEAKKIAEGLEKESRTEIMKELAPAFAAFSLKESVDLTQDIDDAEKAPVIDQIFRNAVRCGYDVPPTLDFINAPYLRATALLATADELMKLSTERALKKMHEEEIISMVREHWSSLKVRNTLMDKPTSTHENFPQH